MGRRKKPRAARGGNARGEGQSGLGVYEAHISPLQRRRLAGMPPGPEPEIQLLRVLVDDCLRRMKESRDEEQRKDLFAATLTALQRMFRAMRTRKALPGALEPDLLDESVEWIQAELGLEG